MDSGWSRFRALYDYKPQDDNEIKISVDDILIVAKPIADPKGWLLAQNEQTDQLGDVPGTYLEYIDDIKELVVSEPEVPPPRPPKMKPVNGGHNTIKIHCIRPVFCHCCEDFVWGHNREYYKCQACEVTCHLNCAVGLSQITCSKKDVPSEEDTYEHLVASIQEWTAEDVLSWLAITNHYTYANMFLDYSINGSKLQLLNEESLIQMGIEEKAHQLSLLYAIQELFSGDSPQKQSSTFTGFHRAVKGSNGDHVFRVKNFYTIQWCDTCGKCLWGLYQQGLQCCVCGLCCHCMCVNDGIPVCPGRRVKGSGGEEDGVFGQELGTQFRPSTKPAPIVVMKCVDAIEMKGLRVEGIYRIVPTGHGKSSLHSALNQNPGQVLMSDQEWSDPLVIASVLKMYFQELPTSLFTEEKYDEFIQVSQGVDCIDGIMGVIDGLPQPNQSVINYFMEHLFRVSQRQQYNTMSSENLARVFAHILLRPMKHERQKIAMNHELQIKVVDTLITQGPWSEQQQEVDGPVEPPPPPVPVRPPRPPRLAPQSPQQPSSYTALPPPLPPPGPSPANLREQVWYWGETSKEIVQERMKEAVDGTYIVRDSKRNPGEYTLTLRKGGVSKLIRIMHQNGKYGFSEPLTFDSVVDLIDFYRGRTLAQYNAKLDVKLTHPLHLYERDPVEDSETEDTIIGHLEKTHSELENKSDRYEELVTEYEAMNETTGELQLLKDAHCSVISVIEEQMSIHETFQKDAPPQSRAVLRQNYDLLKHRLNDAKCELLESERELSNTSEKSRQTDQQMNTLRSQIIELQAQKQTYMDILVNEKGYTQDEVKEIVNEGIRQGCIYQVPDIDLSEGSWWFGNVDRAQAELWLKDCPDGTFLIRNSINNPGTFSVTLSFDFAPRHIHIIKGPNGYGFNKDYAIYATLQDLVKHYHNNTLQKHNRHLATKLVYPLRFFKKNV